MIRFATVLMALLSPAAALAASPRAEVKPEQSPALVQAMFACRGIKDPPQRLACYDSNAAALGEAERKGDVVMIDREKVRTIRRQAFGLPLPSLSLLFTPGKIEEGVNRVTLTLRSAGLDRDGRWVMTSTDNAVWRQTDAEPPLSPPHEGSHVLVLRAALGSFLCKVDGQQAFRCARDR